MADASTTLMSDAADAGPTTFHVVPCTLDGLRVPRGRGVDAEKQEFCKGFIRKKFVAIQRGADGQLEGTLPGGFKAKEVVELDAVEQRGLEMSITVCMRCSRKDVEHKQLRWTVNGLSGEERYRCKNCSYCSAFIRVDLEDNSLCEDCGCEASVHQKSVDDPLPLPPKASKVRQDDRTGRSANAEGATSSSARARSCSVDGRTNSAYKPGQRYKVAGTIMRTGESLESDKITRLNAGNVVEVLEIGTGPTGKRVRVRSEEGGEEGWISVVSDAGVTLLKPIASARKRSASAATRKRPQDEEPRGLPTAELGPWGQPPQPPQQAQQPPWAGGELPPWAGGEDETPDTGRSPGAAKEPSIGSVLGSWLGDFGGEAPAEEEEGLSISKLLGGSLGLDFELLAEEAAANLPSEPVASAHDPPAAKPPDEPEEQGVESLADILARLSAEEVAEEDKDAPPASGTDARRDEEKDDGNDSSSSSCREDEDVQSGRTQHMERMRKRLEERKASRQSQEGHAAAANAEGEEEQKSQEEGIARRQREEKAKQQSAEEEERRRVEQASKEAEEEAALKRAEEELAALKRQEEGEALRRAEEEEAALKRAEEEEAALKRAEEELAALKRQEEDEALRKAEEEDAALRRAEEELAALKRQEEEEALRAEEEEEAALRRAEEELAALKRQEEEEEALRRAEEEEAALKRAEEELAALKRQEEEEEALRRAEEEAAVKRAEEEAALKRAEEEAASKKAEEEEEAARKAKALEMRKARRERSSSASARRRPPQDRAPPQVELQPPPPKEEKAAEPRTEDEPHLAEAPEESLLAAATRRKDLFGVMSLLRDKANPNETNAVGETPLLEAAASGDVNVVALLLGNAADPSKRAPPGVTDLDQGLTPEVRLLFQIFEERKVDTEPKKNLLLSLDPGAHAQARIKLRLGSRALEYPKSKLDPAACLAATGTIREFPDTENHRVAVHMADPTRPVLVLNPLWQSATATVVMLHGLFQSGAMWERLARDLSRNLPHVRFLAPTGPTQGCYFGIGPAWHGANTEEVAKGLEEMSEEVAKLLRQQKPAAASRPDRVALLGFSQGGTLATLCALKAAQPYAGMALFGTTGLYEGYFGDEWPAWPGAAGLEVLQCHGGSDGMASLDEARAGADRLRRAGCRVHFKIYNDVCHTISAAMVSEARAWLASRLPDGSSSPESGLTREAMTSPPVRMPSSMTVGSSTEKNTQVFAMDSDDEASNAGNDDLDDIFGFETPPKIGKKLDMEAGAEGHDGTEKGGPVDDLDAMYDFDAVNNAALASSASSPEKAAAEAAAQEPAEAAPAAEDAFLGASPEDAEKSGRAGADEEAAAMAHAEENAADGSAREVPLERAEPRETSSATVAAAASCSAGKGLTPLAAAARSGDVEEVKDLLRQRADPNERDAVGETPLFSAARGGHADAVAVLLLGKADPAVRSENGLVAADLLPGPPVGALLWLALGAKVSAREQREAFEALEECTRFLVARLLEQRGVRPAVRDVLSEAEWVAACA